MGLDADVPLSGTGIEAGQSSPQEYDDMLHLVRERDLRGQQRRARFSTRPAR